MACIVMHSAWFIAGVLVGFTRASRPSLQLEGFSLPRRYTFREPSSSYAHVTRLHRYDHSGVVAMVEAEALWNKEASLRRRISDFVQLSSRQFEALQQHHRHAQLGAQQAVMTSWTTSKSRLKTARRHRGLAGPDSALAVTGLSRLDSQYVGPIGVGTVRSPAGCSAPEGRSLIFMPNTGGNASSSLEQQGACHLEDESHIWVVLDTGSTNIWVNSDLCIRGACAKSTRKRYSHSHSMTYSPPEVTNTLDIEFGTGRVSGPQAIDDFHVGPFTVAHQTFGMIQEQEGQVFEEVPFEGILGLAFPQMSANHVTPFFDNIIQQEVLKQNAFSFYFNPDNPAANAIFWGGKDPRFYRGNVTYFKVVDPYYWSLALVSFQIGGEELLGEKKASGSTDGGSTVGELRPKAIVDTGTTYFTAQSQLFNEVMSRLPPLKCSEVTEKSHPPLTYRLRDSNGEPTEFVLTNTQYMTQSYDGDPDACSPAFMKIDIPPEHGPAMVLGEVFLRHYYSIFDRGDGKQENARVGFARAAHGDEVTRHLKELTKNQPPFPATRTAVD